MTDVTHAIYDAANEIANLYANSEEPPECRTVAAIIAELVTQLSTTLSVDELLFLRECIPDTGDTWREQLRDKLFQFAVADLL